MFLHHTGASEGGGLCFERSTKMWSNSAFVQCFKSGVGGEVCSNGHGGGEKGCCQCSVQERKRTVACKRQKCAYGHKASKEYLMVMH
jgi:hypothetical protein